MPARSPEEELKELDKKMMLVSIVDAPGFIAIGLGLYAKFGTEPGNLHPIFENSTFSTALLIVGGLIAAWGASQMVSIALKRSRIQKGLS